MDSERLNRLAMRRPGEEWVKDRAEYLGATDVAGIMGVHPYKTPRTVFLEKKGLLSPPELNQRMVHGQNLEVYVMQLYRRDTGRRLHKSRLYRDRQYRYMGCNPDYEVRGEPGLLECKTVGQWSAQEFGDEADAVPEQFMVQCMWQLAITGRAWCDLAVLIAGQDYRVYRIERDEEMVKSLREQVRDWWEKYMMRDCLPPLTGSKRDSDLLNEQWPQSAAVRLCASPELDELAKGLRSIKQLQGRVDSEANRIANEIKNVMENAAELLCDCGRITWKTDKRGVRSFKTYFRQDTEAEAAAMI